MISKKKEENFIFLILYLILFNTLDLIFFTIKNFYNIGFFYSFSLWYIILKLIFLNNHENESKNFLSFLKILFFFFNFIFILNLYFSNKIEIGFLKFLFLLAFLELSEKYTGIENKDPILFSFLLSFLVKVIN